MAKIYLWNDQVEGGDDDQVEDGDDGQVEGGYDDHVEGGDDDHVEAGGSIIDGSAEPLILNIRNGHCHRYRRSTHKKPFWPIWIRKKQGLDIFGFVN